MRNKKNNVYENLTFYRRVQWSPGKEKNSGLRMKENLFFFALVLAAEDQRVSNCTVYFVCRHAAQFLCSALISTLKSSAESHTDTLHSLLAAAFL